MCGAASYGLFVSQALAEQQKVHEAATERLMEQLDKDKPESLGSASSISSAAEKQVQLIYVDRVYPHSVNECCACIACNHLYLPPCVAIALLMGAIGLLGHWLVM